MPLPLKIPRGDVRLAIPWRSEDRRLRLTVTVPRDSEAGDNRPERELPCWFRRPSFGVQLSNHVRGAVRVAPPTAGLHPRLQSVPRMAAVVAPTKQHHGQHQDETEQTHDCLEHHHTPACPILSTP